MFIDPFMDDVTYVRNVEVGMYSMFCYIPGCICYGSENFALGSLHDDYVGLADATPQFYSIDPYTRADNKVRKLIAVKVLHTSMLNATVVAFKVFPFRSYALMPAPSPPFKTILELVLWNDLQSCRCIIPDAINVLRMPSFQYFLYLREQKKSLGARSGE